MSSEVGGGLLGGMFVIALLAPLIIKAVCIMLVGGAVVGAAIGAVKIAQSVNRAARSAHEHRIQENINQMTRTQGIGQNASAVAHAAQTTRSNTQPNRGNTHAGTAQYNLAQTLASRRQIMLQMYSQQSIRLESLSEDMNRQRADLLRQASEVDAQREANVRELQRKSIDMSEQITARTERSLQELHRETAAQMDSWKQDVAEVLSDRRAEIDAYLERIEARIDRDRAGSDYARRFLDEAQELYDSLRQERDAEDLVGGELEALQKLAKDTEDLLREKQGQAAIATAVSFAQQTMEAWVKLDIERHNRQLINEQLNLASAYLRAIVEKGSELRLELGSIGDPTHFERVKNAPKIPASTDFWAEGKLAKVMEEAATLLREVDQIVADPGKLKAAKQERLLRQINDATAKIDPLLQYARANYVCCVSRLQMIANAQKGFKASGWSALGWGFEGKDHRRPLVMRFKNEAGALADLVLTPIYDPLTRCFDVDVRIERHDPGMISESTRDQQTFQLEQNLRSYGVPVRGLRCRKETRGQNAIGPVSANRFEVPGARSAEDN